MAFTAIVIAVIVAFGLLSHWQFTRAEQREREAGEIARQEQTSPASPFAAGLSPWRRVAAEGSYRPESDVAVRKRPLNGANGFWVLSLLDTSEGSIWVNRGWIPATDAAAVAPAIPQAPQGRVTVSGVLRDFEPPDPPSADSGLPAGVIMAIHPASLPQLGTANGYLQAQASVPAEPGLTAVPLPEIDSSRNLSYAIQWLLFAGVAVAGWWWMLRREAGDVAKEREPAPTQDSQVTSVAN